MDIMPIVPYSYFGFVPQRGPMFTECSWALHHLPYRNFLFQRREEVVLDNSSYVSEEPIDADTHLDISRHIPNCMVIATDYLGDGERTRNATADFISRWQRLGVWKPRLMAVAQGNSYEDFVHTYQLFARQEYIDCIGIPFRLMFDLDERCPKGSPDGRERLMVKMSQDGVLVRKCNHHYLGMGYLWELESSWYPKGFLNSHVCSIDSSLIFKAARFSYVEKQHPQDVYQDIDIRRKIDKRFDLEEIFNTHVYRSYKTLYDHVQKNSVR